MEQKRVLWNFYESVLLLEATLRVYKEGANRNTIIAQLSKFLRDSAIKSGKQIDSYYRNENGIRLQMEEMAYLVTGGTSGLPKASKIFRSVFELYTHDQATYERTLKIAKEVLSHTLPNSDLFYEWLTTRVSAIQLSELYILYGVINAYCQSKGIIQSPLLTITNLSMLMTIRDIIKQNIIFWSYRKLVPNKAFMAMNYYIFYIKERQKMSCTMSSLQFEDGSMVSDNKLQDCSDETQTMYVTDLSQKQYFSFTKPIKFKYFDHEKHVKNWKELYIACCKILWRDYPDAMRSLSSKNKDEIVWFCNQKDAQQYRMRHPVEVAAGIVAETNFNATELMRKLKFLLNHCQIAYKNLLITYIQLDDSVRHNDRKHVGSIHSTENPEKIAFAKWMEANGMRPNTIASYLSAINQIQNFIVQENLCDQSLYALSSIRDVEQIFNLLINNNKFIDWNAGQHNRFRSALKKYITYCKSSISGQQENPYISDYVEEKSASDSVTINEETRQRFINILENEFTDGLRQTVIYWNKFKMLYQKLYGEPLKIENDQLSKVLKGIGIVIDGRIYAKMNMENDPLIQNIHADIMMAFQNGASGVYLECIMERYGQRLAKTLGIYNEDALASLLLNQNGHAYQRWHHCLQQQSGTVDFTKDVLRVLKNTAHPMSYDQLKTEIWYLPIEKIKQILVTEPCLVNVDKQTYYYAPNLPITSDELLTLKTAMHRLLAQKAFLVAKDFPALLQEAAPAAAINTIEFKDWALRNIFGVLLNDEFDFGASLVCEKGCSIDMGQAFQHYCRQFERLSFQQIKDFAHDLGVQIYWHDVFKEMIRVSPTELIRKDFIHFDVEAIDAVLQTFCPGAYVPLQSVNLFLHFPTLEVAWNGFVLESYLLNYSKAFQLYQASVSDRNYFGVIVKRATPFRSYTEVVVDMWAHSKEWNDKESALELLVQQGYQARRHLGNIDALLKEAALKREKIFEE